MEPTYFPSEDEPSFWSKIKGNLAELIEFLAILLAIFVILRFFVAEPHKVSGSSMFPNFHDGDYLLTNKLAKEFSKFEKGEVIILHNPKNPDIVFIKRIIGFPGDRLKILNGRVYLNDQILEEPYLPPGTITEGQSFLREGEEYLVPENQYFVMGDNRTQSSDSREWGPISKDLVIGQAYLRYLPLQKFGIIQISKPSA